MGTHHKTNLNFLRIEGESQSVPFYLLSSRFFFVLLFPVESGEKKLFRSVAYHVDCSGVKSIFPHCIPYIYMNLFTYPPHLL